MANVKITQLPLATTPLTGTEVFPLVQGTTTKQVAITGLFTSPVMTNPTLGTVGQADLINATGLPISTGVAGLGTGVATFLGTPSSANLRAAVTDETGSGSLVFATSPTLVTPNLGTPSVLVATNATGTAVGLTAGSAITNANLTGAVTSVGNATSLGSFTSAQLRTALTDETGAGSAVFATSPTITAPILNQINDTNNAQILGLSPTTSAVDYLVVKNGIGVAVPLHFYADGSSANIGLHIQPKGTGLVTISDGTDFNKGIRFRSSSSAASAITLLDAVSTAGRVVTLPDATTTLVGRDTTDTLTNKTIAFSSNTFSGTLAIANGGTGQATANAALNALLPAQTGNATKYLQTDGSNSSWDAISLSTADITGTLGTANGGTGLTSFTSGGVVYASSTSALATGSGLTFNGADLTVANGDLTIGTNGKKLYVNYIANNSGTDLNINGLSNTIFTIAGTETFRTTSTSLYTASGINVGIGLSSPQTKLHVANTGYSGSSAPYGAVSLVVGGATADSNWGHLVVSQASTSNGAGGKILFSYGSTIDTDLSPFAAITGSKQGANYGDLLFFTRPSGGSNTERLRLDSAGNLGLGVTPSAWGPFTGMQIGALGGLSLAGYPDNCFMASNAYYGSAAFRYAATGYVATLYRQTNGTHVWGTTGTTTGTAGSGATFSSSMTLDASGNLLVGTTSSSFSAANRTVLALGSGSNGSLIDFQVSGGTSDGYIYADGTNFTIENSNSGYIRFNTAASERARIDSSGRLLVGTTSAFAGNGLSITSSQNTVWTNCTDSAQNGLVVQNSANSTGTAANLVAFNVGTAGSGTTVGSITYSGTVTLYNTTSDYRLKTVVGAVTGQGARLDALEPIEYEWKSNGSRSRGFLAHKFQEVYADSVTGEKDAVNADGNPVYQAMQAGSSEVIADLVAEIKSLRQRLSAANL